MTDMKNNVKKFDFKKLRADINYIKRLQERKVSESIDGNQYYNDERFLESQEAMSTLVDKLQQYVFDVEHNTIREEDETLEEQENYEIPDIEYDVNFRSPEQNHTNDNIYSENSDDSPQLGNSRDLENRLKFYSDLKASATEIETAQAQFLHSKNQAEWSPSSKHTYKEGSYAQQYQNRKNKLGNNS